MTDVIATVRNRLLAIGAVTAIVATRVTTGMLPQSSPLPAATVQRVDSVEGSHLRGPASNETRVQVTSFGATRSAAVALDEVVQGDGKGPSGSGLTNWGSAASGIVRMRMAGVREDYEGAELKRWRIDRDYMVHHRR